MPSSVLGRQIVLNGIIVKINHPQIIQNGILLQLELSAIAVAFEHIWLQQLPRERHVTMGHEPTRLPSCDGGAELFVCDRAAANPSAAVERPDQTKKHVAIFGGIDANPLI